jgi:hypothetical protein
MPDVEFFCNWPSEDLVEFDDPGLINEAKEYKDDVEFEWQEIELVLLTYPQYFPVSVIDKHLFMRIFA